MPKVAVSTSFMVLYPESPTKKIERILEIIGSEVVHKYSVPMKIPRISMPIGVMQGSWNGR